MNHGDLLFPNIFKVVLDAILGYWVTVVTASEEAAPPGLANTEVFIRGVHRLEEYFYADDRLLASTWETFPQRDFDTLLKLFDRVGICTNVAKTFIIACHPCSVLGGHSVEAYRLHMTGEGLYFQYRIRQSVRCPD